MKYAVVGFGTAGYHAVKKIRELDKEGCIDVYSNTGRAPYNPMLTTYYAFGKLEYEGMFPFGDLEQIQKEVDFNLRKETVIKVHGSEHLVETENGSEQYDRILIATGARAFAPPVKGLEPEDAFLMRTVEDALRFKDRLKKSALGLSGGQQQRLCIARALAVEPEVLLMDEPTSALDPISTSKIEDLAVELKKDYTIVMVTHNMQQAARISDKTAFFLLGEVIEYGETESLFTMPKDKRTEDYITGRFG